MTKLASVKSRAGLLLVLALLIAGAGLTYRAVNPSGSSQAKSPNAATGKPAKPEGPDSKSQREERFPGVDPALKKVIHRLEAVLQDWNEKQLPHAHGYLQRKEWEAFTRSQIAGLETAQIAALAALLHETDASGDLWDYRQAIYFTWASRDPAAARAYIRKIAEEAGFQRSQEAKWKLEDSGGNSDSYIFVTTGHATLDPAAAWAAFLADKDDPGLEALVDIPTTLLYLFRTYGEKDPQGAWKLIMAEQNPYFLHQMVPGYAEKAPAGQNWEQLAEELTRHLLNLGDEMSKYERSALASRWLMDEPEKALDWFAAHSRAEDFKSEFPSARDDDDKTPSAMLHLAEPDETTSFKIHLLGELYSAQEYRVPEAVAVLQQLSGAGQEELAARAISSFIGEFLSPEDLALLAVLPQLPSPPLREALLLQIAQAVYPRSDDLTGNGMTFDHPNVCLDAVRALAAEMDLPDEVRVQAEAAFREVEAREAEMQAAEKNAHRGK